MDVRTYLNRIEYTGPGKPSATALRELHRQHLFTIPFENLDIALGNPIRLSLPLLYQKIIVQRRGGFCYELNGLFAALLTELGYFVQMLSARVRHQGDGFGPDFDHMLLKVDLDEPWLADVGFGESFLNPLPFHAGGSETSNAHHYFLMQDGDEWQLMRSDKDGEVALYRFRDVPRQLSDYERMCEFHQSSADSHFTQNRVCTRATPTGRVTLSGMRLIVTHDGARTESQLCGELEVSRCLRDHFGIDFGPAMDISALCG